MRVAIFTSTLTTTPKENMTMKISSIFGWLVALVALVGLSLISSTPATTSAESRTIANTTNTYAPQLASTNPLRPMSTSFQECFESGVGAWTTGADGCMNSVNLEQVSGWSLCPLGSAYHAGKIGGTIGMICSSGANSA